MLNLSALFGARADRYAKAQGAFLLEDGFHYTGDGVSTWDWFRGLSGSFVTVLYLTAEKQIRLMVGRQGVHSSSQDGTVAGTGHAMASRDGLTLSFWTATYGSKVNTGAGKGYRTLRADRILAVNVDGAQYVTDTGTALIEFVMAVDNGTAPARFQH